MSVSSFCSLQSRQRVFQLPGNPFEKVATIDSMQGQRQPVTALHYECPKFLADDDLRKILDVVPSPCTVSDPAD